MPHAVVHRCYTTLQHQKQSTIIQFYKMKQHRYITAAIFHIITTIQDNLNAPE